MPGNKIDKSSKIQVVYGFGAVSMYKSAIGYTGLKAIDILGDIIEDKDFDSIQVLTKSIPSLRKTAKNSFLPVYKYLSRLEILSQSDYERNQLGINIPLSSLSDFQSYKSFSPDEKNLCLAEVIEKYKDVVWKAVALIPYLEIEDYEMDALRDFIKVNFYDFLVKKNSYSTYMRKLICFYDWKKYGWHDKL